MICFSLLEALRGIRVPLLGLFQNATVATPDAVPDAKLNKI